MKKYHAHGAITTIDNKERISWEEQAEKNIELVIYEPWMEEGKKLYDTLHTQKTAMEVMIDEVSAQRKQILKARLKELEFINNNLSQTIGYLEGFFGLISDDDSRPDTN